jgi:hypothetical protein
MKPTRTVDLIAAIAALGLAIASVVLGDADKAPLYVIVAYALWRIAGR